MTENRVYSSGEKPENPIIRDVVYLISDIREEPVVQTDENAASLPQWSYVVDEVVSYEEYLRRVNEAHAAEIEDLGGAILELTELITGGM